MIKLNFPVTYFLFILSSQQNKADKHSICKQINACVHLGQNLNPDYKKLTFMTALLILIGYVCKRHCSMALNRNTKYAHIHLQAHFSLISRLENFFNKWIAKINPYKSQPIFFTEKRFFLPSLRLNHFPFEFGL